jgi:sodium transport system permease protein
LSRVARAFVRKEVREILRDRKVILLTIVLPVLLYPLTFTMSSWLKEREDEKARDRILSVAVTGDVDELRVAVYRAAGLRLVALEEEADLAAEVRDGRLEAWLDASSGVAPAGADSANVPGIVLTYHAPRQESLDARDRLLEVLAEVRAEIRDRRFRVAGGQGDLDAFVSIEDVDVATEEEAGGAAVGRFVPFLLVVTLFVGGASLSTDVVAGEKERGTLETLYLTPVDRGEIAWAKFIVVTGATLVSGALNLVSMLVCYRLGWISMGSAESALVVSARGTAMAFLLVIPLAALIGGVLLGISAFARTLKEAQYYMTPVMLVAFLPGLLATSQEIRLDSFTALIPVANVALAVRDGLLGPVPGRLVLIVSIASIGWGLIAMRWTRSILSREDTILGFAPEPLFAPTAGGRRRAAILVMAGTVLAYFYLGQLLQRWSLVTGLLVSLWVLLPCLGALGLRFAWAGGRFADVLSLRGAPIGALAGGVLLGAGTVVPMFHGVAPLQGLFLPVPEEFGVAVDAGLGALGPLALFGLVAFSPGVCEEIVFRGAFLGLMRRTGSTRAAVLATSVVFALIHLSVFRFVPTLLLGLVMAILVVRTRSILPAILYHVTYNGIGVLGGERIEELGNGAIAWGGSLALLAIGSLLVARSRTSETA